MRKARVTAFAKAQTAQDGEVGVTQGDAIERGGTIGVVLKADANSVAVSVKDTGCGIGPETGKHIFEKFYQGDTSHATQGNGLGLALVKRVMDILQGEISVQSSPGQGSTFTVRIRRNG